MEIFQRTILTAVLIGFGLGMIAAPDLLQDTEASGRNSLFKALLINLWSVPGGVVSLGAGVMSAFLLFRQPPEPSVVPPEKR